jgi:hypothetical protein
MRYRDAKNLREGDIVIYKPSMKSYTVRSIELYGQYKKVKITCYIPGDAGNTIFYNEEVV